MDLLPVGQFGPRALALEKLGSISRMLPDGSAGFLRGTCRKDSSAGSDALAATLATYRGDNVADDGDDDNGGDDDGEIDLSRFASEKDTRAYFKRKLAIFEASMMTPAAANRRLAARKLEMEGGFGEGMDELDCIPPRQLLMYLVSPKAPVYHRRFLISHAG
uniref:Uncharacterized protein n=1 Tax=Anopheles dirus TaxID=7168 RepID=A0A182NAR3_9DIPT